MAKGFKLNGTTGGFPLFQNDVQFLSDITKYLENYGFEVFNEISTGKEIIILRGVFDNIGGFSVSGGVVFVNSGFGTGEVMVVDELPTVPNIGDFDLYIEEVIDNTLDPTIYKDTSSNNVHITRKLVAKDRNVVGSDGVVKVSDIFADNSYRYIWLVVNNFMTNSRIAPKFESELISKIQGSFVGAGNDVRLAIFNEVYTNGYTNAGVSVFGSEAQTVTYKKSGDNVKVRGQVGFSSGNVSGTQVIDLPASASPPYTKYFSTTIDTGSGFLIVGVRVDTSGGVYLIDNTGATFSGNGFVELGVINYNIGG